jgi:hypothetical protein
VIPFLSICLIARGKDLRAVDMERCLAYGSIYRENYTSICYYILLSSSPLLLYYILYINNKSLTIYDLTALLSHIPLFIAKYTFHTF